MTAARSTGASNTGARSTEIDAEFGVGEQIRLIERDHRGVVMIRTELCDADIAMQGAQVLHWAPKGHGDLLWCSALPAAGSGKAIRGGIPICWPWFGPHATDASQPQHGLVRTVDWRLVSTRLDGGRACVAFEVEASGAAVRMEIEAGADLTLALTTRNTGERSQEITQALHTYFRVGDARQVALVGLDGCGYRDLADGGREKVWQGALTFERETIARFDVAPDAATLVDPVLGRRISIAREGGHSTVAWHPGAAVVALKDVLPGTEAQFVCVESGSVGASSLSIAPGGEHRLVVSYRIAAAT